MEGRDIPYAIQLSMQEMFVDIKTFPLSLQFPVRLYEESYTVFGLTSVMYLAWSFVWKYTLMLVNNRCMISLCT